ncbi:hypothetical protein KIN20_016546 [Parelaphostrongylus tenuis]|uniref:Uncharacterized protein n=1 Tax=Parelaphostrongylus tenuis TaxID=148309 RepID=A0AAD5MGM6_PARTN|nr:hypothetical protein KIN20_016546 [Parelaphostrongylus tenuis]
MANWSREMWQGVVNRAVRMLTSELQITVLQMRRLPTLLISMLATVAAVSGCGVLPQGQDYPTAMVFTASADANARLPGGIATSSDGAISFVSRIVMRTLPSS